VEYSEQQKALFDWVKNGSGSAVLVAVAGAGKTTSTVEATKRMSGDVAFLAYNKAIADEIKDRVKEQRKVEAGTFHSFGFKAWKKIAPASQLRNFKLKDIAEEMGVPTLFRGFVTQAVSLAKQWGIGIDCQVDNYTRWRELIEHFDLEEKLSNTDQPTDAQTVDAAIEYAIDVLKASISSAGEIIDFDDMIYMPLYSKARFYQRDWVIIDEAQDTNPTRRMMAHRLLRPGGRLIAVGDPHQAIFGFTGANSDSLELIKNEFDAIELPLTTTYRCPKAVVEVAQRYVSHIQAHESAPDGLSSSITMADFDLLDRFALDEHSVILCRNNKPLVQLAYSLIRRDIPCHIEGRDFGLSLLKLAERWSSIRNLQLLSDKLKDYRDKEVAKLLAKKQESKADALDDKVECLLFIINVMPSGSTTVDLKKKIENLFGDTQDGRPSRNLTLSSIHKSKGREWNRVYWLGPNFYQPSKYAKQQWQKQQETNLSYVAATRAKQELVIINV